MADRAVYTYVPRDWCIPFHNRTQRRAILVIHRRAGKSVSAVNDVIIAGLECPLPRPQFAYIAPTYVQAKRISWEYLKDYARPLLTNPASKAINESELRVDIVSRSGTPARIFLAGADNPDSLRGIYLDGAVLDEKALIPPSVHAQIIAPALADRGGWSVQMGTPKGKNHFYEEWTEAQTDPDVFTLMLKASESGIIPASELTELRNNMSPEEYEQEMECSFTALSKGLILFGHVEQALTDGRILDHMPTSVLHPSLPTPVYLSADVGRDKVAFWWWIIGEDHFYLIHYMEAVGWEAQEMIDYIDTLPSPLLSNPAMIYLPHDARNKTFASKFTTVEVFLKRYSAARVTIVPKTTLQDRINAARMVMPRVTFAPLLHPAQLTMLGEGLAIGLKSLRGWTFKWDEITDTYSSEPVHDGFCHGADAYSYGAQVMHYHLDDLRAAASARKERTVRPASYNFSLEDLYGYRPGFSRARV